MIVFRHTISVALLISAIACGEPPGVISAQDARSIIEAEWNQPDVGVLLGDIRFVDGRTEASKGRETLRELPLYHALALNGILAITDERDLATNSGGWPDWSDLTRSGVRRTARVAVTDQGRTLGTISHVGTVDELRLSVVSSKIDSIAAGDSVVVRDTVYRMFTGTHTIAVPPVVKAAFEESRGSMEAARRFKVLLKYDRGRDRWMISAMDNTPASRGFTTNYVESRMTELRRCAGKPCT